MNDNLFFRTSRAEQARETGLPVETANEAVIPLALHRAQVEGSKAQLREASAVPRLAAALAPMPVPASDETPAPPETLDDPRLTAVLPPEPMPRTRGRLYLVSRSRGGVGATTFAVNLALGLCVGPQKSRRRVAIVDLDLQFGTVASSLDLTDKGGLLALAQLDHEPDAHAVRAALQPHDSGVSVLPAPRNPVPLDALDALRVQSIIDALLSSHDAVVVDLPPALVDWLEPLLRRAERLFMVTDLAVTSIDCAKRILDTFREDAPDLQVEIIVGREKKPFFAGRLHREIATALDQPLRYWLPFDPKRARLALDRGEPLLKMLPSGAWSRGIRKIVGGLG